MRALEGIGHIISNRRKDVGFLVLAMTVVGLIFSPFPGIDAVEVRLLNEDTDATSGDTQISLQVDVNDPAINELTGTPIDLDGDLDFDDPETIPLSLIRITLDEGEPNEKQAIFQRDGTFVSGDEAIITGLNFVDIRNLADLGAGYGNFGYGVFQGQGYGYFNTAGFNYGTIGPDGTVYGLTSSAGSGFPGSTTTARYNIDINSALLSDGEHSIQVDVLNTLSDTEFFSTGPKTFTNTNPPGTTTVVIPDTTEDVDFETLPDDIETVNVGSTSNLETIKVPKGKTVAKIKFADSTLDKASDLTKTKLTLVKKITISSENTKKKTTVIIPPAVTITGPADWDGEITLPQDDTDSIAGEQGIETIQFGVPDKTLTFSSPVKITLEGQKDKNAYIRSADIGLVKVTDTCDDADESLVTLPTFPNGNDYCKINEGNDLSILTLTASKFSASTTASTPSAPVVGFNRGGGGSGGGGSGGGASGGIGGVISPFQIKEISYDKCEENMAWITIQANGLNSLPDVKLRTSFSGIISAELADEQPYEQENAQNVAKSKFVYEAHFLNGEEFFVVIVEDISGRAGVQVKKSVQVTGCTDTIIVTPDIPTTGTRTIIGSGGIISDIISIATPLVVQQHIGDATVITNENTGLQLANYQTLQSKPDKYAEIILGIEGQTITTIASQDRFGLPESNNNANVFLQISHTDSKINSMRGVELGGDSIMVIAGNGDKVELPKSAEISIPDNEPVDVPIKTSDRLHDKAKMIVSPAAVSSFINTNIEIINQVTGHGLTHYVVLQTVPDKFAQEELGISGQKVTTLAFYDRYGLPESNEDLNVFLQISHTDEQVNSLRAIQLGGDDISVIVNGVDQGIITKTKEVPLD